MNAIWVRTRAELRAGSRAWVSLAVIIGLAAGAVIAASAGARRTESAYPRFLEAHRSAHAMTGGGLSDERFAERLAEIEALPEVEDSVRWVLLGAQATLPARRGKPERTIGLPEALIAVDPSGRMLRSFNKAKVLDGRLPREDAPDEVAIPFLLAERFDLRVGDSFTGTIGFPMFGGPGEQVPLRVVGIEASPGEFETVGQTTYLSIWASRALYEKAQPLLPPVNPDTWSLLVRLRDGPGAAPAFKQKIERNYGLDVPFIEPVVTSGVQKTIRLYAVALWLLAGLVALAAIAILGQTLARQIMLESGEYRVLRALGYGRRQLMTLGLARALAIALVASPVAAGTAFLLSPLTPIGTARIAEPEPGFAFDALVVGIGMPATIGLALLLAVIPSWRAARLASGSSSTLETSQDHPSRVVAVATRLFRAAPVATGLRMALEPGRGRSAVPVRSTILAVAVGVVAVTASFTAGSSLSHLIETPALSGLTYDAIAPSEDGGDDAARKRRLERMPFVADATPGTGLNVRFGDVASFLVGYTQGTPISFSMIDGASPTDRIVAGIPEIAIGPATLKRLGVRIGDVVPFEIDTEDEQERHVLRTLRARVVGIAAIPPLPWAAVEPGEGGMMTLNAIRSLDADDQGGCCFVRFEPDTDLAAARAELEREGFEVLLRPQRADLRTLERITTLPEVLSGIFAVMAVAALAHVLVTGIRRRRRDLAILKTIGFVKRQVAATVAWQASAIAVLSVVVGIPAGIALGRWGWRLVADQFGVVPVSIVPVLAVAIALPVALVLANLIALLPGRAAARTHAAVTLRSE